VELRIPPRFCVIDIFFPMKSTSRSRSGQQRDQAGRFTKEGPRVLLSGPLQDHQVAAAGQSEVGSVVQSAFKGLDAVSGRIQLGQVVAVQGAAVNMGHVDSADDESSAADDEEVGSHDLEGSCSDESSVDPDFVNEEVGKSVDQQGVCSTMLKNVGTLLAHQVLDDLPHSEPVAAGVNRGIDSSVEGSGKGVGSVPKSPWVNLFKDNRNLGKGIKLEEWDVEGDLVVLEEEDVDVVEEVWGYCLVGLFAGKFPGMAAVRILREGWKVNCSFWRHRTGWFVFKFQTDEDRRKVLEGGPYFVYGSNLLLKILPSCFRFEGEDVSSVPIWIQLPGLPLDCWNARALGKIVSMVGKPITTDNMTLTKERLSFARVLVEVDASSDIVSDVEIRLPTGIVYHQLVIAEFTPKFCKKCKIFGHLDGACGLGAEGRKQKGFVAKEQLHYGEGPVRQKGGGSLGVKEGAPCAPGTDGAGLAGFGVARVEVGGMAATTVLAGASLLPAMGDTNPGVSHLAGLSSGGTAPSAPVAKETLAAVLQPRGMVRENTGQGCSVVGRSGCGRQPGPSGAGAIFLPVRPAVQHKEAPAVPAEGITVADKIATRLHPEEVLDSGEVGWTTVGKKGKDKKMAVGPVCPAVGLDKCVSGSISVAHKKKQEDNSGHPAVAASLRRSDVEAAVQYDGVGWRTGYPDPDWFKKPYVPKWRGRGKGRR